MIDTISPAGARRLQWALTQMSESTHNDWDVRSCATPELPRRDDGVCILCTYRPALDSMDHFSLLVDNGVSRKHVDNRVIAITVPRVAQLQSENINADSMAVMRIRSHHARM